ncbi:hypothetical protein SNEBB_004786 [Seison nebaliae]|nr:hypothetical protein SNEBB_004786 [Seison nebaliae]
MHGYPFVAETENKFRRVFWLILSLIGLAALLYFMYQYCNEFLNEKPIITSATKIFLKDAKLPKITICNSQTLRKDKLAKMENPKIILDFLNNYQKQINSEFASFQNEALEEMLVCLEKAENPPENFILKITIFELAISACSDSTLEFLMNHEVARNSYFRSILPPPHNFTTEIDEENKFKTCMENNKDIEWPNTYNVLEILEAGAKFNSSCLNDIAHYIGFTEDVDGTDIYQIQKIQTFVFSLLNLFSLNYYGEKVIAPLLLTTNLRDALFEASWNIKNFIITCTMGGNTCNLDEFNQVFTSNGLCYEFKTNVSQKSPGNFGGLQLMLNTESYNQYTQTSMIKGVDGLEMIIHHETEPSAESLRHIPLPTGTLSYVTVKNMTTVLLDESKGGNCNESSKLDLYPHFTTFGCEYDCKYRTMEKLCNCMSWEDVRIQESRDYWRKGCYHYEDLPCITNAAVNWRLHADCKKCQKPSCVLYNYAPKVMSAKLMNTSLEHYIITQEIECLKDHGVHFNIPFNFLTWKAPLDDIRNLSSVCLTRFNWNENIVQVNVFYDEISEIRVAQLPKYTITDFIGCIGGTMGIYTGMSLITIFEVLEYLFFRVLHI